MKRGRRGCRKSSKMVITAKDNTAWARVVLPEIQELDVKLALGGKTQQALMRWYLHDQMDVFSMY